MNKIPNRQAICEVLMDKAKEDKDIMVLCSDSRGSASMTPFADNFPDQFIETGIAEQNLVSISAGLAKCGKKPFACSPACFLSTRSYEQASESVTSAIFAGSIPNNPQISSSHFRSKILKSCVLEALE